MSEDETAGYSESEMTLQGGYIFNSYKHQLLITFCIVIKIAFCLAIKSMLEMLCESVGLG